MPPEKFETFLTLISKRPPESVPLLVIPPAKVDTPLTLMGPHAPAEIVPALLMPPENVETPLTRMPLPPDVIVPVLTLTMPPVKLAT